LKIPTAHILSSPSSLFPFLNLSFPSLSLEVGPPQLQVGGLGEHYKLPSGVWGEAQPKYLVATTLKIFLRVD